MQSIIPSSLTELPACLERRSDGAIVVRGHRVTLFALVDFIKTKSSAVADLLEAFPTLSRDLIWDILHFYSSHSAAVEAYYGEQLEIAAKNEKPYSGPSLEELKRRRQAKQQ
jgi:uncharacterized protein (DUF433 family)